MNGKQIYKITVSYTIYCDHRSLSENKSLLIYYIFLLCHLSDDVMKPGIITAI